MKHSLVFISAIAVMSAFSCGRHTETPSTEFNAYISSFTGGTVSRDAPIQVNLTHDISEEPQTELFSFKPAISGKTRWISGSSVEFVPDEGSMKAGTTYEAAFRLSEVVKVKKKDNRMFRFSFRTASKTAGLELGSVRIDEDNPATATVEGKVRLSDSMDPDKARARLKTSSNPETSDIKWVPDEDNKVFSFTISGIVRGDKAAELKLSFDAGADGYESPAEGTATIPGLGDFKVTGSRIVHGDSPFIEVAFSEPLAKSAASKGLISLKNVGRYFIKTDSNIARLYYSAPNPLKEIVLKVSDVVKSRAGTALAEDYTAQFSAGRIMPAVKFAFSGNILPDEESFRIPIKALGLKAVDVSVIKIYEDNLKMFFQDNVIGDDCQLKRSGRLIYKNTVRLDGDPMKSVSETEHYTIDLSGLIKRDPGSIYRVRLSFSRAHTIYASEEESASLKSGSGEISAKDNEVWDDPDSWYSDGYYSWDQYRYKEINDPTTPSYYMTSERFDSRNLFSSGMGIIAKMAGTDRLWVCVADLASTSPVQGAEITAYNYQLREVGKGSTGSDGFAELSLSGKPFLIAARHDSGSAYLRVKQGEEKSLSRFDTSGEILSDGMKGFVYGERGVWRPGDTLHLAFMTDPRRKSIPEDHPVLLEVYTPQGQFHTKKVNTEGVKGLYRFDVPTAPDDPTGIWNAYFKVGGSSFHKALHIETVKPNRLKVQLKPQTEMFKAGQAADFELSSSWLTGSPAASMDFSAEMTLSRRPSSFKSYPNFRFDNPLSEFRSSTEELFTRRLDTLGKASVRIDMPQAEGAPGMLNARIVSRVMEPGGDVSITAENYLFSPFRHYVGIEIPGEHSEFETDRDLLFPVVSINEEGQSVPGRKLDWKIYKLDWGWWWESRAESLDSYVTGKRANCVANGSVTSGDKPVDISFKVSYPDWGRFLILVKDEESGHSTGGVIYVDWPSWRGRSDKGDPDALAMLTFSTDKKSYEVGEQVSLYIPAADEGRALVSLENGNRVISRDWVQTKAGEDTRWNFTVTADMLPNVYIHVSLLQKHRRQRNDLPIRLYGVQPVRVTDGASRLEPELTLPEVIRPRQEFEVKIREKHGKPMTYTLAIVDEGLLDITSFKTPDPWAAMNAKEALGVRTWDMYDNVVGAFSGKFTPVVAIGGDEGFHKDRQKESRFNPVVRYFGPFDLTKGSATHRITLPMYVGSVRVMVVAGRDGAFGNAEKAVPVRNPLMILPTLPRVLGTAEKVVLPVNVFALENNIRNVTVNVKVEGPAKVSGPSKTEISFSEPGDRLCRFNLVTGNDEGMAKVTVTAAGDGFSASETINIEVRNPLQPVSESRSMLIEGGGRAQFEFEPFKASEEYFARLRISNFPAVDFGTLFSGMYTYPYCCTEQLSAIGLTMLSCRPYIGEASREKADGKIREMLRMLYSRQLSDGSFTYWTGSLSANEWAGSMAGHFMAEAAAAGFDVNAGSLASWKRYQKKMAGAFRHDKERPNLDMQQAYRLYTLAVAGAPYESAMNRLEAAEELSAQAQWRLAAAYALCGKPMIAKELMARQGRNDRRTWHGTYGGTLRDDAMAIETAVLAGDLQSAMSLAAKMESNWHSASSETQFCAFASIAMNRLAAAVGSDALDVRLEGASKEHIRSAQSSVLTDLDSTTGKLQLENLSKERIWVTLQTRRSAAGATPATESNMKIAVRHYTASGREINPGKVRQGQNFIADISVSASSRDDMKDLALSFPVPSGWEIINDRLSDTETATAGSTEYSFKDIRDDRVTWHFDLDRGVSKTFSVRLQAAYEGEYVLPDVKCEAMYDADSYASTGSSVTRVVR